VEAIEIPRVVLQQERRRPRLAGPTALLEVISVAVGISLVGFHPLIPLIGECSQMWVQRGTQPI
jgi:hypothetical protein